MAGYTDEEAFIFAETDGKSHNTITPIARRRWEKFELDLVLRNDITTEEHPMGIYSPTPNCTIPKKENIGLIEVMGLAVLPARLKQELSTVADTLVRGADLRASELTENTPTGRRASPPNYAITADNALDIVKKETGLVFAKVLEYAGVYGRTDAGRELFLKFLDFVR